MWDCLLQMENNIKFVRKIHLKTFQIIQDVLEITHKIMVLKFKLKNFFFLIKLFKIRN